MIKNIHKLWKMLKKLHILQYQMFSQDLIICVKTNKHIHLTNMPICSFLINDKIVCMQGIIVLQ